jgi:hypothetical protein
MIVAAALLLSAGAEAIENQYKCVIQLDNSSGMAILAAPSTNPLNEALAYPLTGFGDAAPGDLVIFDRSKGVTLKVTEKAASSCVRLLPETDPHAHH